MLKIEIPIPPEAASRPEFVAKFKKAIIRKKYKTYKDRMIEEFNKYSDNEELKDILQNAKYGINMKVIYKFDNARNKAIFKRQRPDLDNLVKATIDSLFESKVNNVFDGYDINEDTGYRKSKYHQIVDDSNIVRMELIKINTPKEKVGQTVYLSKILEEDHLVSDGILTEMFGDIDDNI